MFSNVIVDIAFPRRPFVLSQSSCEASAGLTDVGGVSANNITVKLTNQFIQTGLSTFD